MDVLEYLIKLSLTLLLIWPFAAFARPKRPILMAAAGSTLLLGVAFVLGEVVANIRLGR